MSDLIDPRDVDYKHKAADCETCAGAPESTIIVNRSLMWHDGDVICSKSDCCRFVRTWDAG